ncbi:Uncharacterized protein NMA0194 [Durusdinium trenchii]|uniref:Uncharacterized protein NMA0194 n=1 Tax=Durusdinium trenchii TaxID=1381693 RepID=A0ABP0MJC7_9DINO
MQSSAQSQSQSYEGCSGQSLSREAEAEASPQSCGASPWRPWRFPETDFPEGPASKCCEAFAEDGYDLHLFKHRCTPESDVNDWEGDSLQGSPNPSEVEQLLGKSRISSDLPQWISRQLHLEKSHVAGAVRLFNEGSTLPFIARYRKEQTGSMKEEDLRRVEREMSRVKDLEKKRGRVALALNRGKHLNPSLVESLLQAETVEGIEGLWAPFKAKRQTRAQKAKEQGLEPLAKILEVAAKEPGGVEEEAAEAAQQFVSPEVPDVQSALRAARDILAEQLAHRADLRQLARQALESKVLCRARRKPGADEEERFKTYWSYEAPLKQVKPHQFLAIQRGEASKCLTMDFLVAPEEAKQLCETLVETFLQSSVKAAPTPLRVGTLAASSAHLARANQRRPNAYRAQLSLAMTDSWQRLLLPSLQREWRRRLKERAEDEAFDTFRKNLKKKLMSPPLRLHPRWTEENAEMPAAIIGMDPGFRTGCKCALISLTGQVLATKTIFPHPPSSAVAPADPPAARADVEELLAQGLTAPRREEEAPQKKRRLEKEVRELVICSLGNGTASRETESWLRRQFAQHEGIGYVIVDEAGASVYSASPLASKEMPSMDVSMRGAVSIARRLLDPLAELVKIDPRSIGVGLYQHDVDQKRLAEELRGATMDSVNSVIVGSSAFGNLGTHIGRCDTSGDCVWLLLHHLSHHNRTTSEEHVAGLNASLSRSILQYREEHGGFSDRQELLKIKGFGPKSFQQSAGFLRIFGGKEPLDALPIHPESYAVAKSLRSRVQVLATSELAAEFGIGFETLSDICSALENAADGELLDPRRQEPSLRIKMPGSTLQAATAGTSSAIDAQEAGITAAQLQLGLRLTGVVRNVVAFGAFIDIGVGCDGLLHISNYPKAALSVNDQVEVRVLSLERRQERGKEKWRIGLTMK